MKFYRKESIDVVIKALLEAKKGNGLMNITSIICNKKEGLT